MKMDDARGWQAYDSGSTSRLAALTRLVLEADQTRNPIETALDHIRGMFEALTVQLFICREDHHFHEFQSVSTGFSPRTCGSEFGLPEPILTSWKGRTAQALPLGPLIPCAPNLETLLVPLVGQERLIGIIRAEVESSSQILREHGRSFPMIGDLVALLWQKTQTGRPLALARAKTSTLLIVEIDNLCTLRAGQGAGLADTLLMQLVERFTNLAGVHRAGRAEEDRHSIAVWLEDDPLPDLEHQTWLIQNAMRHPVILGGARGLCDGQHRDQSCPTKRRELPRNRAAF